MGGWWFGIGVGPSNFKIDVDAGSGIEGADGVNFEIRTPDPVSATPLRDSGCFGGSGNGCWLPDCSVVARVLAGRSVVALTAAAGGFAGGDCVFPDISLVAQVARPLRRMCN